MKSANCCVNKVIQYADLVSFALALRIPLLTIMKFYSLTLFCKGNYVFI